MTRLAIFPTALVTGMSFVLAAHAATANNAGNPYEIIIARNVFGLNPPPQAAPPPVTNTPPSQVQLVGIARIFGVKKALLKIAEGNKPADTTLVLKEGERVNDVDVLEIDETASTVKVSNRGAEAVLVFSKDLLKGPSGSAVPMPGVVPVPGFVPPPPAAGFSGIPAPQFMPAAAPAGFPMPAAVASYATASAYGAGAIPTRPVRTEPVPSIEVQTVMMEVERERTKDAVAAGMLPPLPPTDLTPQEPTTQAPANPGGTTFLPPRLDPRFPRR